MDADRENPRCYAERDRLLDGRHLLIRAMRPDDKAALQDGMHRLSAESSYLRFFRHKHELSPGELIYFTEVDFENHVALVAILPESGADLLVGVGRYIVCERSPLIAAEVAFAVDDVHHGLGIATVLLRHLTRIARAAGVAEFRASVLAVNRKMLDVFSHSGLPKTLTRDGAVIELRLSLGDGDRLPN